MEYLESVSDSELDLNRDVFTETPVRICRRGIRNMYRRSSVNVFCTSEETNQKRPTIAVRKIIDLLRAPCVQTFTSLKKTLDKFKLEPEWISDFLQKDGLELLFTCLEQLCKSNSDDFINVILQVSCVECVRTVMDSTLSLDYIVENKEFTKKLASGIYYLLS